MKRARSLSLIGVLLIGSSIAVAQAPPIRPGPAGPDGAPTITLDFEDVDITDVIKVIAEITGKNYLYH